MEILKRWGALLLLLLAAPAATPAQPAAPEYDVKAAFLYNFTKFVDWPAGAFPDERSSLRICVLGDNPFGNALQAAVGDEIAGHRLTVVRSESISNPAGCHVLFISRSERERLARILGEVRNAPVLTVADSPGFLEQGGAINFVLDRSKVRFEINREAAERAGLRISSKLLQLATRVLPAPQAGP
jgi:hypothetical protein